MRVDERQRRSARPPEPGETDTIIAPGTTFHDVTEQITSVEQYRRTLLFQSQGLSSAQIGALGGGASQFTISGGNPYASIVQYDVGPFIQDDWRLRPNLTLSLDMRYEAKTNVGDYRDTAPRLGFARAPGSVENGRQTIGSASRWM